MSDELSFDIHEAHVYFSTQFFHSECIEQTEFQFLEEKLALLHTAIVSLWHWSQRKDVKTENLSTGYWQVSRVFNLIKQADNARTYGLLALKYAEYLEPFFKARAYETLARAEMLSGNRVIMNVYLDKAHAMAKRIEDEDRRSQILKDLDSIR